MPIQPGGHLIVTAGVDGTARLWRTSDGTAEGVLGPRGEKRGTVSTATFSRDGAFVVTAQQGIARVWRTASRNLVTILRGHNADTVYAASFSPDESRVVTAGADGTARLWDAGQGSPRVLLGTGDGIVSDLAVDHDPDGMACRTRGAGNGVQLWASTWTSGPRQSALTSTDHEHRDQSRREVRCSDDRRRNDARRRH